MTIACAHSKGNNIMNDKQRDQASLKDEIVRYADEIGLDLIGITTTSPFERYLSELDSREEHYTKRYAYRLETWRKMATPKSLMPEAESLIVIGFHYLTKEQSEPPVGSGRFARIVSYGHLGILVRTQKMQSFLQARGFKAEMGAHRKEAAVRAGLGAIGKNGLVINPKYGSWVAYQTIITNAKIETDAPFTEDLCGDCEICLKSCPTNALYEPYKVNPQRCVPYLLTDKNTDPELWPKMGDYILGCDICLNACPRNHTHNPKENVDSFFPFDIGIHPSLEMLLKLDEKTFQRDLIGYIQNKIMPNSKLAALMRIPLFRKAIILFTKTFMKGKEKVPETFVHASGSLNTYKRNAMIAAANLRQTQLKELIAEYANDPELGECARWSVSELEKSNG